MPLQIDQGWNAAWYSRLLKALLGLTYQYHVSLLRSTIHSRSLLFFYQFLLKDGKILGIICSLLCSFQCLFKVFSKLFLFSFAFFQLLLSFFELITKFLHLCLHFFKRFLHSSSFIFALKSTQTRTFTIFEKTILLRGQKLAK